MTAMFKKSLKSKRWNKIDLGEAPQYTHDNMVSRWVTEKNKWLNVSINKSCNVFHFLIRFMSQKQAQV